MFRYFLRFNANSAIYCATRFIHGKHENPLNIRNITSNVYIGAIIFPCLNMLIWRVRSIATDESRKIIADRKFWASYFKRPLNDLEETIGVTVDAKFLFKMLNKALFERKLVGH